jgi:hypothetical protein
MASNWERWAPLSGVLAVILWIVGFLIIGETKDKPAEILAQVRKDDVKILIGSIVFWIGCGFFLWFLGSLRTRLMASEGPAARLTAVAYGAGVGTTVCLVLLPAATAAAAINKDDIDASAASAMSNMSDAFFLGAEYLLPWVLFAFAIVAIRYGAFPKWLGWLSVLIGIGLLTGWIGWAFLILGLPLWTLITSILLYMRADRPASTMGQPAAGATG